MTDLDALISELRGFAAGSVSARAELMRDAADAVESTAARLREAEAARDTFHNKALDAIHAMNRAQDRLREAEATIDAVRTARANHPACDKHPESDPVTCGWKRAVLDIDGALSAYQATKTEGSEQ